MQLWKKVSSNIQQNENVSLQILRKISRKIENI